MIDIQMISNVERAQGTWRTEPAHLEEHDDASTSMPPGKAGVE